MLRFALAVLIIRAPTATAQQMEVTVRPTTLDAAQVARIVTRIRDTVVIVGTTAVHPVAITVDPAPRAQPPAPSTSRRMEIGAPAAERITPLRGLVAQPGRVQPLEWMALLVALAVVALHLRAEAPREARLRK
jgi:hypothetical protein